MAIHSQDIMEKAEIIQLNQTTYKDYFRTGLSANNSVGISGVQKNADLPFLY